MKDLLEYAVCAGDKELFFKTLDAANDIPWWEYDAFS